MNRRDFLKTTAATAAALASPPTAAIAEANTAQLVRKMPRWRGFNLLESFLAGQKSPYVESDFQWISQWGFDFVRLPMDYRCWTDANDPYKLDEKMLARVDQAVQWGRKYGIHVCLNLHRAPGYTVAQPPEALDLWTNEEAQNRFDFQWSQFARRYRGIGSEHLSFNLVNEPAKVAAASYAKVARRAVAAIRRVDRDRLIISDGLQWGREPVFELADLGVAQSTRGYEPMPISHWGATWVNTKGWPKPAWPLQQGDALIDRQWLSRHHIEPWKKLEARGVGVHVGEWGAYNQTPHEIVLAWARDFLSLWKEAGWGWALWNFRGAIGIIDSGRKDVAYEDFRGHKLDRKMLSLLQQF
jgi:endoglucanase